MRDKINEIFEDLVYFFRFILYTIILWSCIHLSCRREVLYLNCGEQFFTRLHIIFQLVLIKN